MIREFQGEHRFLSNFFVRDIVVDGVTWPSTEHYYQAMKTEDPAAQELVRQAKTPKVAKVLSYSLDLRDDWTSVKEAFMLRALEAKFGQHPDLAALLLATFPHELSEGNYHRDAYWGVDLHRGTGLNRLGVLLMKVRDDLLKKTRQPEQESNA